MSMLDELRAKRNEASEKAEALVTAVEARDGSMTDEERAEFDAHVADIRATDERIKSLETVHEARAAAAKAAVDAAGGIDGVKSEPLTYERYAERSYYADLALAELNQGRGNPDEARARLQRHAKEMEVELEARFKARDRKADAELRNIDKGASFEKRAASSTTTSGVYYIPPLWLEDMAIPYLRFGRVAVNLARQLPLPEGTNSINIPKLTTPTVVQSQTGDNTAVASQDVVASYVNAPVRTIAGQEDVSLQLLEQSPSGLLDAIIFQDLAAAYNTQCDNQFLNGTGGAGQVTGIVNISGINTVTFTNGSPSGYQLYTPVLQAVSQVAKNRKRVDGVTILMTPSRWFWLAASLDSQNRPLVVPSQVALNTIATSDQAAAEGYVGNFSTGFPVAIDGNITTTDGTGANQDQVYAIRGDDFFWFEGSMRTRVLPEVLSGTLGVRFQAYNYVATLPRYATAVSQIAGTGLTAVPGF